MKVTAYEIASPATALKPARFQRIFTGVPHTSEVVIRSGVLGKAGTVKRTIMRDTRRAVAELLYRERQSSKAVDVVEPVVFDVNASVFHCGTDIAALEAAYFAAAAAARAGQVERAFAEVPGGFDDLGCVVAAFSGFAAEARIHPWAAPVAAGLAAFPHVHDARRDVALVVVPAATGNQISYLWGGEVAYGGPSAPGDSAEVLDAALRLWQDDAGALEELPAALEAARLLV